ncbi:MAG: ABC transporter permease [Eubacteriaceae bacterium]|nr:ABC transporter permease [Eubacteriaceae bacterium]
MNGYRAKYILNKAAQMIIVLIVLSIVVFVIARLCPGDPLKSYYGDGVEHMSTEQKYAAREKLGLNESIPVQYVKWAGNALQGDWGISYKYKRPVTEVIGGAWQNTLLLGGLSFILTFVLAILLGMFCAMRENSRTDRIICKTGVISSSIPTFFLAILLILFFAVDLPVFPSGGAYSYGGSSNFFDRIYHLILPVTVMVLQHLWYYTYMIRNKLIEETRQDYVLLCKVKGLSKKQIIRKHCFRNILPSLLTIMAISVPHILGGTYVVEMVFSYPGLGTLSFESARYQDYNMLMALCLLTGLVVLVFNLAAQIINEFIDPRMKYEKEAADHEEA